MNGRSADEYKRLKLIERGINPDTGERIEYIKEESIITFCTREGNQVSIPKVFSGMSPIVQ